MVKPSSKFKVALLLLLLLHSIDFEVGDGDRDDDETSNIPTNIIDAAMRLFSLPTTRDSWLPPPNLDFRAGSGGNEEPCGDLKDAVVKSLDKSRATVQDSAKSVANNLKHKLSRQDQICLTQK